MTKKGADAKGREEAFVSYPAREVDVGALERELRELWKVEEEPARGPAAEGEATVTRACMSNLVIFTSSERESRTLAQEIAVIVREHPARVILLAGTEGENAIDAHVSAVCYLGEHGRQICSEHVNVHAAGTSRRKLPSVARALLLGDLPTALWWTGAPPVRKEGNDAGETFFRTLASLAEHVIYDSAAWAPGREAARAGLAWAAEAGRERAHTDLAWHRLLPWRRVVGQALDPSVAPGALSSLSEVHVVHGPGGNVGALLLAGWLASRLGWHGSDAGESKAATPTWWSATFRGSGAGGASAPPVRVTLETGGAGGGQAGEPPSGDPCEIREVRLTYASEGGEARARCVASGRESIRVMVEGAGAREGSGERVVSNATPARPELVARAMSERGHDPHFRAALRAARAFLDDSANE